MKRQYKTLNQILEDKPIRHKGTVIEVYNNGSQAAVEFYCNFKRGKRIECVNHPGSGIDGSIPAFHVGQSGIVGYQRTLNGYIWTFEPSNNE